MRLYHLTPRRHLTSIMRYGLLPGQHGGVSTQGECKWAVKRLGFSPVFLTSDPERLRKEQLTLGFITRHDIVTLLVDTYRTSVFDERILFNWLKVDMSSPAWTFVSFEPVPPQKLALVP